MCQVQILQNTRAVKSSYIKSTRFCINFHICLLSKPDILIMQSSSNENLFQEIDSVIDGIADKNDSLMPSLYINLHLSYLETRYLSICGLHIAQKLSIFFENRNYRTINAISDYFLGHHSHIHMINTQYLKFPIKIFLFEKSEHIFSLAMKNFFTYQLLYLLEHQSLGNNLKLNPGIIS